ncbi:hypothetical protein AO82_01803 [Mycobacterium tuberculosis M2130]|uniref:hypothetical protein n=1 Tax=Mycobacterium tuberculosis TaxID=1773 RepID=UPI00045B228D|nr:hypothetical protein [Mycobacterium tuberculosis]KAM05802.1 hypothetical protein AO51_01776 [Mycobacterium tuberculosis M1926]KBC56630.1 hypothetical protein AO82_01803 [Mycobacterium tuberculosis M2130]
MQSGQNILAKVCNLIEQSRLSSTRCLQFRITNASRPRQLRWSEFKRFCDIFNMVLGKARMGRDPGRPVRDERRIVSCEIIASDHIGLAAARLLAKRYRGRSVSGFVLMIKSASVHEIDSWSSPSVAMSIGVALCSYPHYAAARTSPPNRDWGEDTTRSRPVTGLLAG